MKYCTLLALIGLSNVNTIDFDGDGKDDTDKNDGRDDMMDDDDERWYEEDEIEDEYADWDYEDFAHRKEFVMLAAMNANQTADADGSDELGIFKVGLFSGNRWQTDIFRADLNDSTSADFGNYTKGWTKTFARDGKANEFELVDDCHIQVYMEELDADNVTAKCEIDLPCTNTAFSYAPCWLKGTTDDATSENRHGYYMLTYSIRDKFMMEDWATCDIFASCGITVFGKGFWCSEY